MSTQQDPVQQASTLKNTTTDPSKPAGTGKNYNIKLFSYPEDPTGADLQHYVEFQINVRGKSKFNKDNRLFEVKRDPDSANLSESQLSTAATVGAGIAGGIIGYGITKKIAGLFGKTGAKKAAGATAAGVVGGVAGAAAGAAAVNASSLLKPDTLYRIDNVIALHLNEPPAVRYSMNYANKELGTMAGILGNAAGIASGKLTGEAAMAAGLSLAKLPSAFGATDLASIIGASGKVALNPFKEVLFESVDFRSFNFKYKFLPKSPSEVKQVKDIIKLFKFHMHPEMSEGKLFFIYPSEFQITYYYNKEQNNYFHKFASCVLEGMDVTYGGEQFSSFKGGEPTEINMSLTFRETEILTKNMIEKGY